MEKSKEKGIYHKKDLIGTSMLKKHGRATSLMKKTTPNNLTQHRCLIFFTKTSY